MKTILVGISSRFIHSNLACYYLKEYCPDFDIDVVELNVNMPYNEIKNTILDLKADFIGFSCYIFNIEVIKKLLIDLNDRSCQSVDFENPDGNNDDCIGRQTGGTPRRPKIILGGPESGYEYEELLPLADYIVIGEGEEAFKQILSEAEGRSDGRISKRDKKKVSESDGSDCIKSRGEMQSSKCSIFDSQSSGMTSHAGETVSPDILVSQSAAATSQLGGIISSGILVSQSDGATTESCDTFSHQNYAKDLQKNAKVIHGAKPDLKTMPSPYTDYLVENVVRASKNNKILYFESSRGCPYKCSYCMSSLSGGVRFFPMERTKTELRYLYSAHPKQIKFVDRTFNANLARAKEIIQFIIDMTAGDASTNFHFEMSAEIVDDELIEIMSAAAKGLIQIEIGVQSFNPAALAACDRACDIAKLDENIKKFMRLGNVHIHLDLIAGLPEDSFGDFRESVNKILAYKPDYLQVGFLKLLKGSKMRADAAKYKMRYKDEAPYEIISSEFFTEEELGKIRAVAAAVGTFYNKHRYDETLAELHKKFDTPFEMFLKIGTVLESGKYQKSLLKDMHNLLLDLT